uniref:Uncharacterized protein n=1 Tax=Anguilla anguilla TaxID=7936 RepID=A0A0E9QNW1_ANGAN
MYVQGVVASSVSPPHAYTVILELYSANHFVSKSVSGYEIHILTFLIWCNHLPC